MITYSKYISEPTISIADPLNLFRKKKKNEFVSSEIIMKPVIVMSFIPLVSESSFQIIYSDFGNSS